MSFREIFKNRSFSCLWLGQVISQFGDRLHQMALIGLMYQKMPGSSLQLAKLFSFMILPIFILGPVAGVYVDRWSKKSTMFFSDILRGILVFLIPFYFLKLKTLIPIYIVVFFVSCISRFFVPAKLSIIPELVRTDQLHLANSLISTTGMIGAMLGFGLGGFIVEKVGVKFTFLLDSISFFISAGLISLVVSAKDSEFRPKDIILLGEELMSKVKNRFIKELREGFFYLFKEKASFFTLKKLFVLSSGVGALYTTLIVFIQKTLGSATRDLGLIAVMFGIGLFLSSLVYGKIGKKISIQKILNFFLLAVSLFLLMFIILLKKFPSLKLSLISSFFLGSLISPIIIGANTLIHKSCQGVFHGRIFSCMEVIVHFGFLFFMILSSWIAHFIGEFKVILGTSFFIAIYSFFGIFNKYVKNT